MIWLLGRIIEIYYLRERSNMKIGIVICGLDDWEKNFFPLVQSILDTGVEAEIRLVGREPFPLEKFQEFNIKKLMVVLGKLEGYAQAINYGLRSLLLLDDGSEHPYHAIYDWILIMNSDVRCDKSFIEELENLDPNTLYGNKIHKQHKQTKMPIPFIDGWIYAIPGKIIDEVGAFDEEFKIAGFEDADYCLRAFDKGYVTRQSNLPFTHLEHRPRKKTEGYTQIRLDNLAYLKNKHNLK